MSHAALAAAAVAGGADTIQFRQKGGTVRDRFANLVETVAACRAAGVACLVDDALDLALAAGADGVHLGALDLPVATARRVATELARPFIVGATATTAAAARAAESDGADYIGFGPVFPTRSKAAPASVKGVRGVAEASAAVSIPVIAIAGITPVRVRPCLEAGAHGVAVMTAVSTAPDPELAARAFRAEVDGWAANRSA